MFFVKKMEWLIIVISISTLASTLPVEKESSRFSKIMLGVSQRLRGQDERRNGQKMSVFFHAQGIKTVHAGQKMAKFCPLSSRMPPNNELTFFSEN